MVILEYMLYTTEYMSIMKNKFSTGTLTLEMEDIVGHTMMLVYELIHLVIWDGLTTEEPIMM